MIAIHKSKTGFHPRWVAYCQEKNIPHKIVDCYDDDLIRELEGCKALMWHINQNNPKDIIIGKQILFTLEHTDLVVFPDFKTAWHFNDKVAQKYLFERIGAPLVPSFVFYDKNTALNWINSTDFPKVFKLRGGAGSSNVKLVHNLSHAKTLVNKAFKKGHPNYDAWGSLKERWYKYKLGKVGIIEPIKGLIRFIWPPPFTKILGREVGYIYFQDYLPNNDYDTRIIVIAEKAFALRRYVRKGDFRASGSGVFSYEKELFDERCVKIAFELTEKLDSQCAAYDFIFDDSNMPLIVEVSFGYIKEVYYPCPGYWDKDLNWREGNFNHEGWIVDLILKEISLKR